MSTEFVDTKAGEKREVELPPGHYRVFSGAIKPGDRFLNMLLLEDGITQWEDVPVPSSRAVRKDEPYSRAGWFSLVIRKGQPVQKSCESCHVRGCALGYRLCLECRFDAIAARRKPKE